MKSILFVAIQALVRACLLDSVSYSLACLDPIITRKKLNIIWSFEPDTHCNSTDQFVGQTGFFLAFSYSPQVCTKVHKIVYIAQRVYKSCLLHKIVSIAQIVFIAQRCTVSFVSSAQRCTVSFVSIAQRCTVSFVSIAQRCTVLFVSIISAQRCSSIVSCTKVHQPYSHCTKANARQQIICLNIKFCGQTCLPSN